ncbi:Cof-type HAD-IIB family hydrolase [Siccirubricoccus sp. G192]|uniref:Cof-type HAD-IIB family hydrolase n=1 Tax=Siccirubricoccus sp. G192 TaxID=2849651 RepID=UPI001C2BAF42|nr:Cof-type HAD-IIB family hydrolase [Siccirubricoccus sp. G192]MBV1795735.1 Cof-type HAD-IIB family hydrolase [Siccirubricoccus sp. G192]
MTRPRPARLSLLLADVDGTLVTRDKVLTERAARAARALRRRSVRFAITSGRPPQGMAMLVEPLGLDLPIAGFNGGQYVRPDLSVIEGRTLQPEAARRAASIIRGHGLDLWVYAGADWLLRDLKAPHVAREQWTVKFPPRVVAELDPLLDRAVKLVGVSDDLDLVARCERTAQEALGGTASAARSQPYYLDVTHPQANKGDVVDWFAHHLGIAQGEVATIGDQPNDVLMFRRSGFAIAMGNASPEVQAQADATTASYDDEGFARAVERLFLDGPPP